MRSERSKELKGCSTVLRQVMMASLGLSAKDDKKILRPSWQHVKIPDYKSKPKKSGTREEMEMVPFRSTLLCTVSDREEKVLVF